MPKRSFETVSEFEEHTREAEELIFDGTENPTERPQDNDNQKSKYSGKKKTHTDIALILSDKKTRIYYVSQLYDGSNVDMAILKKEFTPGQGWFKKYRMLFDLGFVGVEKIYEMKEVVIGKKKPRKSKNNPKPELSKEQKVLNKKVSSERIFVEHAIGKMKIFRVLKNRCRFKCPIIKNKIIGVCAGLWNHKLSLKS
jgi:hypothetical protein